MFNRIFVSFCLVLGSFLHGDEESPTKTEKPIFISGVAGFIGFSLANHLLDKGYEIYGCDNLLPYYDVKLKEDRLAILLEKGLNFYPIDVREIETLRSLFEEHEFKEFIHLAAQAGVRYSLTHPEEYIDHNIVGFFKVLEFCKNWKDLRLIYASSSSVYGDSKEYPQQEMMSINSPNSLYSATKISNELFARVYNNVHQLKTVGLRFFTVYGPWGRPDMAHFIFADAIDQGKTLTLFNNGNLYRDFTYIDDLVDGIVRVIHSDLDSEILNLGKGNPDKVGDLVSYLEQDLGKKAHILVKPLSKVEGQKTYADIAKASQLLGYYPKTDLREGVRRYVEWYKTYYKNK